MIFFRNEMEFVNLIENLCCLLVFESLLWEFMLLVSQLEFKHIDLWTVNNIPVILGEANQMQECYSIQSYNEYE